MSPHPGRVEIPSVLAGLITVILIGIAVGNLIFNRIEQATVIKWGMKNSGGRNTRQDLRS